MGQGVESLVFVVMRGGERLSGNDNLIGSLSIALFLSEKNETGKCHITEVYLLLICIILNSSPSHANERERYRVGNCFIALILNRDSSTAMVVGRNLAPS